MSGNKPQFSAGVGKLHRLGEGPRDPNSQVSIPISPMPETLEGFEVKSGFLAFASLGLGFSFSGWAKSTHSLLSGLQTSASIASSPILSIFWVSDFSKIPL